MKFFRRYAHMNEDTRGGALLQVNTIRVLCIEWIICSTDSYAHDVSDASLRSYQTFLVLARSPPDTALGCRTAVPWPAHRTVAAPAVGAVIDETDHAYDMTQRGAGRGAAM